MKFLMKLLAGLMVVVALNVGAQHVVLPNSVQYVFLPQLGNRWYAVNRYDQAPVGRTYMLQRSLDSGRTWHSLGGNVFSPQNSPTPSKLSYYETYYNLPYAASDQTWYRVVDYTGLPPTSAFNVPGSVLPFNPKVPNNGFRLVSYGTVPVQTTTNPLTFVTTVTAQQRWGDWLLIEELNSQGAWVPVKWHSKPTFVTQFVKIGDYWSGAGTRTFRATRYRLQ